MDKLKEVNKLQAELNYLCNKYDESKEKIYGINDKIEKMQSK